MVNHVPSPSHSSNAIRIIRAFERKSGCSCTTRRGSDSRLGSPCPRGSPCHRGLPCPRGSCCPRPRSRRDCQHAAGPALAQQSWSRAFPYGSGQVAHPQKCANMCTIYIYIIPKINNNNIYIYNIYIRMITYVRCSVVMYHDVAHIYIYTHLFIYLYIYSSVVMHLYCIHTCRCIVYLYT